MGLWDLPFVCGLPMFYFLFRDDAKVFRGFTKAQQRVSMVGVVLYILAFCLWIGAIAICMYSSEGPGCRKVHSLTHTVDTNANISKRCLANLLSSDLS